MAMLYHLFASLAMLRPITGCFEKQEGVLVEDAEMKIGQNPATFMLEHYLMPTLSCFKSLCIGLLSIGSICNRQCQRRSFQIRGCANPL
jgi:hypothetical protein